MGALVLPLSVVFIFIFIFVVPIFTIVFIVTVGVVIVGVGIRLLHIGGTLCLAPGGDLTNGMGTLAVTITFCVLLLLLLPAGVLVQACLGPCKGIFLVQVLPSQIDRCSEVIVQVKTSRLCECRAKWQPGFLGKQLSCQIFEFRETGHALHIREAPGRSPVLVRVVKRYYVSCPLPGEHFRNLVELLAESIEPIGKGERFHLRPTRRQDSN